MTVDGSCPSVRTGALAGRAAERGWKYAHIVLDRGRAPVQPMVTFTVDDSTLGAARAAARAAAEELAAAGCPVVRVKVEAAPWARGVPATDSEGATLGPEYYFEHHVKLLLPPDTDTAELARLAVRHTAHLSRNARRARDDGQSERFVTQRCHAVGEATAERRLDALLATLSRLPYRILSVEREFVVHDSARMLDAGWITEERAIGQGGGETGAPS
ncbi:hypothetical protein JW592_24835 [Streptomyces sp. DW4-2]|uniref:Uncharacterized protein n=1 Tax=Streptomyces spirodelae TaxID=2812904 RepID=A0ABS3X033_9ACTN|nr:hypothetical protein [Streptomyces spirodelae]